MTATGLDKALDLLNKYVDVKFNRLPEIEALFALSISSDPLGEEIDNHKERILFTLSLLATRSAYLVAEAKNTCDKWTDENGMDINIKH